MGAQQSLLGSSPAASFIYFAFFGLSFFFSFVARWLCPGLSSEPARPNGDGYMSLCVAGTAGREIVCNVSLNHQGWVREDSGSGQGGEQLDTRRLLETFSSPG